MRQLSTHAVTVGLLVVISTVTIGILARGPKGPKPPRVSATTSTTAKIASATPIPNLAPGSSEDQLDAGSVTETTADYVTGFSEFADGSAVPELPESAPQYLSFGVVLFAYQGAEFAPDDARPKEVARRMAESTMELARSDFSAAVQRGDAGSTLDAGKLPRGVLEPPIEYVLFTLAKGAVYPTPVDTPRGYWIIRRSS